MQWSRIIRNVIRRYVVLYKTSSMRMKLRNILKALSILPLSANNSGTSKEKLIAASSQTSNIPNKPPNEVKPAKFSSPENSPEDGANYTMIRKKEGYIKVKITPKPLVAYESEIPVYNPQSDKDISVSLLPQAGSSLLERANKMSLSEIIEPVNSVSDLSRIDEAYFDGVFLNPRDNNSSFFSKPLTSNLTFTSGAHSIIDTNPILTPTKSSLKTNIVSDEFLKASQSTQGPSGAQSVDRTISNLVSQTVELQNEQTQSMEIEKPEQFDTPTQTVQCSAGESKFSFWWLNFKL